MTVVMVNLLIAQVSSIGMVSPQKLYVPCKHVSLTND